MTQPDFDLTGRLCVVTGATSGLGWQFALCLAQAGAEVVITGRRAERLDLLAREITTNGGTAHALPLDVNEYDAVTGAIRHIEEDIGPIWCLVNNSGVVISGRAENHSEADYDSVLDTNLKAPFHLCQEVGRYMIERGKGGRIVNISSMGAYTELKGSITYCMSKAGVSAMTRGLALEWARHGIRINAICPGYIKTELNADYFDSEAGLKEISSWPARRIGKDTDLNGLLLLLASDESDFMNGSLVEADDGQPLGM